MNWRRINVRHHHADRIHHVDHDHALVQMHHVVRHHPMVNGVIDFHSNRTCLRCHTRMHSYVACIHVRMPSRSRREIRRRGRLWPSRLRKWGWGMHVRLCLACIYVHSEWDVLTCTPRHMFSDDLDDEIDPKEVRLLTTVQSHPRICTMMGWHALHSTKCHAVVTEFIPNTPIEVCLFGRASRIRIYMQDTMEAVKVSVRCKRAKQM